MMIPTYQLIVFDLEKSNDPLFQPKLITVEQWNLLREDYTREVELDNTLYFIERRRSFGISYLTGYSYFLTIDVKKIAQCYSQSPSTATTKEE